MYKSHFKRWACQYFFQCLTWFHLLPVVFGDKQSWVTVSAAFVERRFALKSNKCVVLRKVNKRLQLLRKAENAVKVERLRTKDWRYTWLDCGSSSESLPAIYWWSFKIWCCIESSGPINVSVGFSVCCLDVWDESKNTCVKVILRVSKGKGYQIGLGDYIEYLVCRDFAADVKLSSIVMNDFYFVIKFTKSMLLVSTWHFSCKKVIIIYIYCNNNYLK